MASNINADNGVVSGSAGLKTSADSTGVLALQTNGTTAVTVDTSQNVTFANSANLPNTFGFKNRIINGAMVIDQRNAGASGTANGYTVDRWQYYGAVASKGTWQQNAGSVTPPSGYTKYLGFTSSSAYTVGASENFSILQFIEGYNSADLSFGSASASTVTLSFWVRSSLTGTFGGALLNSAANRSYPFTYSISSANTWEQKSITIVGDTSGTWLTTTGTGIQVNFGLGVGSTYSGTASAWASALYVSATGATSVVGTNGATWYVTGVQLEKSSTTTSFDVRPYATEFALCQRYFQTLAVSTGSGVYIAPIVADSASTGLGVVFLPVVMRTSPSLAITLSGGTTKYRANMGSINDNSDTNPTIGNTSSTSFRLNYSGFSALTANTSGWVNNRDSTGGYFGVTAEL
jgi:hypothetical protein